MDEVRVILLCIIFVAYFVGQRKILIDYGRKCGYIERKKNKKNERLKRKETKKWNLRF